MKGAFVFLLCAAYALADISSQCPSDFTIEKLLPHKECNKYYHCVHGNALERTCHVGLYYNTATQQCDYKENVDCSDRTGSLEYSKSSEDVGPQCECPKDWSKELLFAHADCDKFYKCYKGEAVVIKCQDGLLYEPEKQWCDWPANVQCDREIVCGEPVDGQPSQPGEVNPECPTDWSQEKLLPHSNCDQFLKCEEGVAYPQFCPPGLKYNIKLQVCDWPQNVDCTDRN